MPLEEVQLYGLIKLMIAYDYLYIILLLTYKEITLFSSSFLVVMEKFTENTRFCLIGNYLTKIIPALQSRCTRFRFGPLDNEQMTSRLEHVIKTEG